MERWPRKKPLDVYGNLDHVTSGLGLGGAEINPAWMCVTHSFNGSNIATLAALAEVCTLLSAILVLSVYFKHKPGYVLAG